ncbi:MAG: nucleotidyltransferase domain-containing protein [Kiritimatiellaeota bacterium]|nr:nucleotidyltransferase domain-containing protein [Kiritimatiellota bacterium]
MISLIEQKRKNIAEHCRRLNVKRLDVFGSAVSGNFNFNDSDLDFIVEFDYHDKLDLLRRYLDLAENLETLFNRKVDLLTTGSIKNPVFRANVEAAKENIYAS